MKTLTKKCIECGKVFEKTYEDRKQWENRRVCSVACRGKYLVKLPGRNEKISESQKGDKNSFWKGGENRCVVCKKLIGYKSKHCKNHQPPNNWKGEKASYHAVHAWVYRHRGRPQKCEHCGTTEDRAYHWANKSKKYKRELSDWIRLCVPCHSKHDKNT